MREDMEERVRAMAEYLIEHQATVREAAKAFGVSKSTAHKDLTLRLKRLDARLADGARAVLNRNKRERHIRGGMATREKYHSLSKKFF